MALFDQDELAVGEPRWFNNVRPESQGLESRIVSKNTKEVLVYEQLDVDFEIENTLERKNEV
ncbi:hypothetical protein BCON_0258g00080 [Botryotinia convoluta]|uniref:Uncharacterized protein n=1 Tax=Botryotinia convoluta TaxID=54673 RepID=A0A4Z1HFW4_9HELO|nr:hypothetical protein BCON_0258g00080 [Botryotinia convoluta]